MSISLKRIGVIGAGQMGNGIAHVAALKGFDVKLYDVDATQLEKAKAMIGRMFSNAPKEVEES